MRINIQSRTDLGVSHDRLDRLVIGLDLKHPRTKRMPQTMNGKVWKQYATRCQSAAILHRFYTLFVK